MMLSTVSNSHFLHGGFLRSLRLPYGFRDRLPCQCLGSKTKSKQEAKEDFTSVEKPTSTAGLIGGVVGVGAVLALGAIYKQDIQDFLKEFVTVVEGMGIAGYFSYAGLYIILETVAVPATPLTLTAGYLFGVGPGVCVVSVASTIAATLGFSISRYLFRQKAMELFSGSKQFAAIDKAIEKDGFKFVFLLRLSPLLPFAASNYLYGLTSVKMDAFVLASWIGMLPGTWAYISAGSVGRSILDGSESGPPAWELFLGLGITALVLYLTGSLAKDALKEIEEEEKLQK